MRNHLRYSVAVLAAGLGAVLLHAVEPAEIRVGQIGRTHFGVSIDCYHLSDAAPFDSTARGATVSANVPLAGWLDLGVIHVRASVDGPAGLELERRETLGLATLHRAIGAGHRGYFRAGYGAVSQKILSQSKSRAWLAAAGVELALYPNFAVTPAVEYVDAGDLDDREWRFGLAAEWRLARHWALTLRARHAAVSGSTDYQQYSAGVVFGF